MASTDEMGARMMMPVNIVGFLLRLCMRRRTLRVRQIPGSIIRRGAARDHGVGGDGTAAQARSLDGGGVSVGNRHDSRPANSEDGGIVRRDYAGGRKTPRQATTQRAASGPAITEAGDGEAA